MRSWATKSISAAFVYNYVFSFHSTCLHFTIHLFHHRRLSFIHHSFVFIPQHFGLCLGHFDNHSFQHGFIIAFEGFPFSFVIIYLSIFLYFIIMHLFINYWSQPDIHFASFLIIVSERRSAKRGNRIHGTCKKWE